MNYIGQLICGKINGARVAGKFGILLDYDGNFAYITNISYNNVNFSNLKLSAGCWDINLKGILYDLTEIKYYKESK